jgi:hypothetical protein
MWGLINRPFWIMLTSIRDYAAALAAPVQKWFLDFLARKKSPKVSVLEAESARGMDDNTKTI